jgi:hypothetical protein
MSGRLQLRAERAPFVMLPRWLLYHQEVGEGAKFLYCVLHDLVAGREGPTRPVTRAKLAELCRVSANTIDRRLAELIAAGAVDKEPQILAGGQVANVYHVWLTPPEQRRHRLPPHGEPRSERIPTDGEPVREGDWAVDNRLTADGEAPLERIPTPGEPPHSWGAPVPTGEEPTVLQEQELQEPPTPRTAGEPQLFSETITAERAGGRRGQGTSLRSLGTNPRARQAADRIEARAAAVEAKAAARLEEERAGDAAVAAFEAEALAVSAALDDHRLDAVVAVVRDDLVGPLAHSALPVTRAVVDWYRLAAAGVADASLAAVAVDAALAAGQRLPDVPPVPLTLPAAAPGTVPLHRRVASLMGSRAQAVG